MDKISIIGWDINLMIIIKQKTNIPNILFIVVYEFIYKMIYLWEVEDKKIQLHLGLVSILLLVIYKLIKHINHNHKCNDTKIFQFHYYHPVYTTHKLW